LPFVLDYLWLIGGFVVGSYELVIRHINTSNNKPKSELKNLHLRITYYTFNNISSTPDLRISLPWLCLKELVCIDERHVDALLLLI